MPPKPNDLNVAMGRAVKGAAARSDMLHSSLASRLGIHPVSLSRKLNGHKAFSWPELVMASHAISVDLGELITEAEVIAARMATASDVAADAGCDLSGKAGAA